jgi:hypothetical protein
MTYEEATTILEAFTAGIAGLEDAASPDAGAPGLQKTEYPGGGARLPGATV